MFSLRIAFGPNFMAFGIAPIGDESLQVAEVLFGPINFRPSTI